MNRRGVTLVSLALAAALVAAGCGGEPRATGPTLTMWHTFGPDETAALNETLAVDERTGGVRVVATVLPFGRAQNRLATALARGTDCPDLARVDATWLPGLAAGGFLTEPDAALLAGVTPEARELAEWNGHVWGVPQAIDGLALIADAGAAKALGAAWPPKTVDALEVMARGGTMSIRADGYWFIAFLRAAGGDVLDPASGALGVDRPEAAAALTRYGALAAGGGGAEDDPAREVRRFRAGDVKFLVGGPWTLPALGDREITIASYPHAPDGRPAAPRGGAIYVVPRCATHAAEAWALAGRLTAPALQADWSRRLGVVPTRRAALAEASPKSRAFTEAIEATRLLPRDPLTPQLFDDLTPAVQAVLAGDATAEEALAGVARGWRRLLARRGAHP